jgi:citrate lyase subunit beta-like protein
LLEIGFSNFILPKFRNINDLKEIEKNINFKLFSQINFILLVENPESLFFIKNILISTGLNIIGLGFGSQDYCNETGMDHSLELLRQPRFIISGIAKAFGIQTIDIACMDIKNNDIFINELKESEIMGFDAKFIIHPNQLEIINNYKFYSNDKMAEAEEILKEYERLGRPTVFVYNGKAVEPPHIIRVCCFSKVLNLLNISTGMKNILE